ncbi:porin [Shewanella aestuarii]|uniref:Porin n=1 Tax=Shewanella aestuarii TaxID=1028752 RepID=A0A6G9QJS1_9GAMM|nr:porin [Shewanella aestuarii]QIR14722.1 porin [Shewanella aestuarii]
MTIFPAQAVEVYKSDLLNLDIGGNLQLGVINQENNSGENATTVFDNGTRAHFDFSSEVNSALTFRGFIEWNINAVARNSIDSYNIGNNSISLNNGTTDFLKLRRGFFSAEHDTWGEFSIGKRVGAYASVTSSTDMFNVYSAIASSTYVYGDGGLTGTGRVDNGIYWKKAFGSDEHNFTVNLQGQFIDDTTVLRDENGDPIEDENGNEVSLKTSGGQAASVIYAFDKDKLTFGLAYVNDEAEGKGIAVKNPNAVAGTITSTMDDWYFAAVAAHSEGMYQDNTNQIFEGTGFEVMLSKNIGNWKPMIGWSHISPDSYNIAGLTKASQYELDMFTLTLNYNIKSLGFFAFIEGVIDNGTNADGSDSQDDYVSVGMYYPF